MIGGTDIVIPALGGPEDLDLCVRVVLAVWPGARFEDALTGEQYTRFSDIPFGRTPELFAYRDAEAEAAWEGHRRGHADGTVYLVLGPDAVTLVVDDPQAPHVRSILDGCRTMLESEILRNGGCRVNAAG